MVKAFSWWNGSAVGVNVYCSQHSSTIFIRSVIHSKHISTNEMYENSVIAWAANISFYFNLVS